MKFLAGFDDLFDHLSQLINFDRKDSAKIILVTELGNCILKCPVDRFDPMPEQILKPNDQGEAETAIPRFVYDFENIDCAAFFLKGAHLDIAGAVDREITGTPAIDIV